MSKNLPHSIALAVGRPVPAPVAFHVPARSNVRRDIADRAALRARPRAGAFEYTMGTGLILTFVCGAPAVLAIARFFAAAWF